MDTRLSVNINKVALIRNARGEGLPDLRRFAMDCEEFGADGITVHPRPDERHIRYADIPTLKEVVTTELNIEGNPSHRPFMDLCLVNKPDQVTLVPDTKMALTSDSGWDTVTYKSFLCDVIQELQQKGIRVSIFCNADTKMIEGAADTGTDRIELYTGPYARNFSTNPVNAVADFSNAAKIATTCNLGINAGHDLNLKNLAYFSQKVPNILEVSIGHALISDALYFGIQNTIQMYQHQLRMPTLKPQ